MLIGITQTSTAFGPSTTQRFNQRFPSGVAQQSPNDETEDNIYAIIQGACWCKGYSTGASAITKHFYSGTGGAITHLKTDAGCSETTSTVTLNVMKALLSMDQFRIVGVPTLEKQVIQTIQRTINNQYEAYIGLSPCDGAYGREMNLALIKVLQAIEGYAITCFVSDMSTGYSGNKGFRMPQNWNFDQFAPMSMTNSDGTWAIDKVASSGRFEAVESLSERYLYEGDFVFTGEHSGTNIKYGGNRLRAYITPIGESENVDYSNLHVEFLIRPQTSVSPYYDTFKAIIAPIDGSVYDFAEMIGTDVATDDRDFMRISSDTNYYATYSVVGENGEVVNNVPVRVIVSIETEEY